MEIVQVGSADSSGTEFPQDLASPRKVMVMVKAGE